MPTLQMMLVEGLAGELGFPNLRRVANSLNPAEIEFLACSLAMQAKSVGMRVVTMATVSGCDYQAAYRLLVRIGAHTPARHHKAISDKQHESIISLLCETELTRRQIAAEVGVSKGSVDYRAAMLRRRAASRATSDVAYSRERWHCPQHGWVSLRPCVACRAAK